MVTTRRQSMGMAAAKAKASPKKATAKATPKRKASSKTVSWSDTAGTGVQEGGFFRSLGALLLLLSTPPFTLALWSIFVQHGGSATSFALHLSDRKNWKPFLDSLPTLSGGHLLHRGLWSVPGSTAAFGARQGVCGAGVPQGQQAGVQGERGGVLPDHTRCLL